VPSHRFPGQWRAALQRTEQLAVASANRSVRTVSPPAASFLIFSCIDMSSACVCFFRPPYDMAKCRCPAAQLGVPVQYRLADLQSCSTAQCASTVQSSADCSLTVLRLSCVRTFSAFR
jgi:hypothetical protein